jgi:hypothetical protein
LQPNELGARAARANTLSTCFNPALVANGPRKDKVTIPAVAPPAQVAAIPRARWPQLLQEHFDQAVYLERRLPIRARTGVDPDTIATDIEAGAYMKKVFTAAQANGSVMTV